MTLRRVIGPLPDPPEGWVVVEKCPDYEVNRVGDIRRRAGLLFEKRVRKPVRHHYDKDGYARIYAVDKGKRVALRVHQAVSRAFIGPCPSGKEVNHIDGEKLNNCADNLEYLTKKENLEHKRAMGLCAKGTSNGSAVLTESLVVEIRRMYRSGATQASIAKTLGLRTTTVHQAIHQYWLHVSGAVPSRGRLKATEKIPRSKPKRKSPVSVPRGSELHSSKLTDADVIEIRRLHAAGVFQQDLSERFGVSQGAISGIVNRKRWVHI